MAKLHYMGLQSLDGYIADAGGNFDWAHPNEELHAFVNDLQRPIGTYLVGRRLYEVMVAWESVDTGPSQLPVMTDFATLWRAAEKIVYSTTMTSVSSARTHIERTFDPDVVAKLKATAPHDISVGGPLLAEHLIKAGLVNDYHLFVFPVVVGGGRRFLPVDVRLNLELVAERRFDTGVVYLRYQTASPDGSL